MSNPKGPKGFVFPKPVSTASEADITQWLGILESNGADIDAVDELCDDITKLCKLFEKKTDLSAAQATHTDLKKEAEALKANVLDDIAAVPTKTAALRSKYDSLHTTLEPMELLFGSNEDFECVNKAGETKCVKDLIANKSHLLI